MAKNKSFRIIGITVSISWVMFIALAFFIKSIGIVYGEHFSNHAIWIAIVSGIILLIGAGTGTFAVRSLVRKGKDVML